MVLKKSSKQQKPTLTKPKKPAKAAKSSAPTKIRKQTIPANLELQEQLTIERDKLLKELLNREFAVTLRAVSTIL